MNDSNTAYNAKMFRELTESGLRLPGIDEIVLNMLLSSNGILKKEEIDNYVCNKIQFPMDSSISGATSAALKNLESIGKVEHVSHGYWKIK